MSIRTEDHEMNMTVQDYNPFAAEDQSFDMDVNSKSMIGVSSP